MLLARVLACVRAGRDRACALGLLLILIALVPLAHASPPDPVWIAGIYDGADFDEVIGAVISATGLVSTLVVLAMVADIVAGAVQSHDPVLGVAAPSWPFSIRAPPFGRIVAIT